MKNESDYFRFQRFSILDGQCGMKIGTDAVLLGAWANVAGCRRILDIGTGCGLIAMMLAQRTEDSFAAVDAIDFEESAASQAAANFSHCPWPDRVTVRHESLQNFTCQQTIGKYDLCVCNPPFFSDSSPSLDPKKSLARHCLQLTREQLMESCSELMNSTGRTCVILPFDQLDCALDIALGFGLHLSRQTNVRPFVDKPFKRVLLEFRVQPSELQRDEFAIRGATGKFSTAYESLTRHFHPRFAKS